MLLSILLVPGANPTSLSYFFFLSLYEQLARTSEKILSPNFVCRLAASNMHVSPDFSHSLILLTHTKKFRSYCLPHKGGHKNKTIECTCNKGIKYCLPVPSMLVSQPVFPQHIGKCLRWTLVDQKAMHASEKMMLVGGTWDCVNVG